MPALPPPPARSMHMQANVIGFYRAVAILPATWFVSERGAAPPCEQYRAFEGRCIVPREAPLGLHNDLLTFRAGTLKFAVTGPMEGVSDRATMRLAWWL